MIPRAKVDELVQAHTEVEDPATGAIWIRRDVSEVWLVEVIPTMADDERAHEPTFFNPGVSFRFPIALVAGNCNSLEAALRRDAELAKEVANGEVVLDHPDVQRLISLAKQQAIR